MSAAFDPAALLRLLADFDVDYVLVGGYAGAVQGANRPTLDLDIVRRWDEDNLAGSGTPCGRWMPARRPGHRWPVTPSPASCSRTRR